MNVNNTFNDVLIPGEGPKPVGISILRSDAAIHFWQVLRLNVLMEGLPVVTMEKNLETNR